VYASRSASPDELRRLRAKLGLEVTETIAEKTGAESVRWDLAQLYSSPGDPEIEKTLAEGLAFAQEFEKTYKGRIAELEPSAFAEMMARLGEYHDRQSQPALYAMLLHSLKTHDPVVGRLVGRIRESGAERGRHLVFFGLELAALTDEQAERLYSDPEAGRYKHTVEQERRERPHQLSETEERLLTEISPVGTGAWTRLFEELTTGIMVPVDGT
jgi:oligoendopeptidase F